MCLGLVRLAGWLFVLWFLVMIMADDLVGRLGRLGILADLTEPELRDLAAELNEASFPQGH